jgi:hypothetical protein
MMAAGKVSKFAEGVPSLKLNLKMKSRGEDVMEILCTMFPPPKITQFSSLFSLLTSPLHPTALHSHNLRGWEQRFLMNYTL